MPRARTRSELDFFRQICPIVDELLRIVLNFSAPQEFDIPRLFKRCDDCYWYSGWMGWIYNMSFERRICHRNKRA